MTGRRVQIVESNPALLIELAQGGVFRFAPVIPADSTWAGHWFDVARFVSQDGFHSNYNGIVRVGQVLPVVVLPPPVKLE
ncbi:MAG TPA: hypothetical protein VJ783_32240 [Pirellulales bacterium]|nr:hypothetical protein [Pirellulales bacterium]